MFKKLFGKNGDSKQKQMHSNQHYEGDSRNQNENMYTTILASKTQQKLAGKLMRALERTGEVLVESKESVVGNSNHKKECAENTVRYIRSKRVTGVVVLSSKELDSFLQENGSVQLQIAGEDAALDCKYLAGAFKAQEDIKSKLLVVVPNGGADCPTCLQGVDILQLSGDDSSWDKDIVARFMQKISMR